MEGPVHYQDPRAIFPYTRNRNRNPRANSHQVPTPAAAAIETPGRGPSGLEIVIGLPEMRPHQADMIGNGVIAMTEMTGIATVAIED